MWAGDSPFSKILLDFLQGQPRPAMAGLRLSSPLFDSINKNAPQGCIFIYWGGRRDSNPRSPPPQGGALAN